MISRLISFYFHSFLRYQTQLNTQVTLNRSSSTSTDNSPSPISTPNPNPNPPHVVSTSDPMGNVTITLQRKRENGIANYEVEAIRDFPPNTGPTITSHNPIAKHEAIRDFASPIQEKKQQETSSFTCLLCFCSKNDEDRFNVKGCNHFYCKDCIGKYVSSKLENNVVVIGCPELGCGGKLELEFCREVLSRDVLDRWGDALCESLIQASQKFYCPFKDCSALLMNDGGEVVMESECPYCRRLFCAQCKVPWHAEIKCEEFQRLKKEEQDDLKMKALAEKERWRRCPICNFYVQKVSGCNFIRCRCGSTFCYLCGKASMMDHYCGHCKR